MTTTTPELDWIKASLQLHIPQQTLPVLSRLAQNRNLYVNISGALQTADSSGWYNIELIGQPADVSQGILYLNSLPLETVELLTMESVPLPPQLLVDTLPPSRPPQADEPVESQLIHLRVPRNYRQTPVIGLLVAHFGLSITFLTALLQPEWDSDGWFTLRLHGYRSRLQEAITTLRGLNVHVWLENTYYFEEY